MARSTSSTDEEPPISSDEGTSAVGVTNGNKVKVRKEISGNVATIDLLSERARWFSSTVTSWSVANDATDVRLIVEACDMRDTLPRWTHSIEAIVEGSAYPESDHVQQKT